MSSYRRPEGVWAQIARPAKWMRRNAPIGICPVCGDMLPVRMEYARLHGPYVAEHYVPGHPEFTYDGTEYSFCRGSGYASKDNPVRLLTTRAERGSCSAPSPVSPSVEEGAGPE